MTSEQNKAPPSVGPWAVEYDPEKSPNIWIAAPANSGVCKIETCDYGDGKGEVLTAEDFANAHLIAAAPDLLTALERMTAAYRAQKWDSDGLALSLAAIAKAAGAA